MPTLFFLLSGEHPTLPFAELKAVLEAEGFQYRVLAIFPQVALIKADPLCVKSIASRCSLTRVCGLEVFHGDAEKHRILRGLEATQLEDLIEPGQSFEVRVRRVRGSSPELGVEMLEREIGGMLLKKILGIRVQLEKPSKTFFSILSGGKFVFGLKLAEVSAKPFIERGPRRRPFFHPTTMPPKLARCMVNLARTRAGQLLLDPFCGAGGLLIEAGLIGCRVIGSDIRRFMVAGSLRNLRYYGVEPIGMAVADARSFPFEYADVVVTDPPYGRGATTLKMSTRKIVSEFLKAAYGVLPEKGFVCTASPKTVGISEVGEGRGYRLIERHFIPVHRSLTREIAVFRKMR